MIVKNIEIKRIIATGQDPHANPITRIECKNEAGLPIIFCNEAVIMFLTFVNRRLQVGEILAYDFEVSRYKRNYYVKTDPKWRQAWRERYGF